MEKENTIGQVEEILGKLPEIEEGYEWKYLGVVNPDKGDFYFYGVGWNMGYGISHPDAIKYPTMRKVAVASPTKITDLVGEDWQKRFWLISQNRAVASAGVRVKWGKIEIKRNLDNNYRTLKELISCGIRWSHRGDTPYEDANEFVL